MSTRCSAIYSRYVGRNRSRRLIGNVMIVGAVVIIASSQFFAGSESFAGGTTIKDLEGRGCKCVITEINSVECTKKGAKTYLCNRATPPTYVVKPLVRIPKPLNKTRVIPNGPLKVAPKSPTFSPPSIIEGSLKVTPKSPTFSPPSIIEGTLKVAPSSPIFRKPILVQEEPPDRQDPDPIGVKLPKVSP